jgi:hypothetical protein
MIYRERESFEDPRIIDVRRFLRDLHHGKFAGTVQASRRFIGELDRLGFSDEEAYEFLREHQEEYLKVENIPDLEEEQCHRWDSFVGSVEGILEERGFFEERIEPRLSEFPLIPLESNDVG